MNLFKFINESEIKEELVAIQCQCGTQIKIPKKVIERDESFLCPHCRKNGFIAPKF